jgi:hypothetical protein
MFVVRNNYSILFKGITIPSVNENIALLGIIVGSTCCYVLGYHL